MKRKPFVFAAAMLTLAFIFVSPAHAAGATDHFHQSEQVVVSDPVTIADNSNQAGTSTEFFLYIENPITNTGLPKTGDSGPDLNALILAAMAAGSGYLACTAYASRQT